MSFDLSIIVSSYKRLEYFRRTLLSLSYNWPSFAKTQLIVCEEHSDQSQIILQELQKYSFPWKFILCDLKRFEEKTGIKKYYNNASWCYNVGVKNADGRQVCIIGNDIIVLPKALDRLIEYGNSFEPYDYIIYSSTYNCPQYILEKIDSECNYISLYQYLANEAQVMQSPEYRTMVNNYLSLTKLETLNKIHGWDIQYTKSIGAEDSCVSRRILAIPNTKHLIVPDAISIHQDHPSAQKDNQDFWDKGVKIARERYHNWDGSYICEQEWPITYDSEFQIIKNY